MSDIVEKLLKKKIAAGFEMTVDPVDGHGVLETKYEPDPVCQEAAAEIERLRKNKEAGLKNFLTMQGAANTLRLRAEKEELRSRNARSENEIERLRSLVHDAANYLPQKEYPSEENSDE